MSYRLGLLLAACVPLGACATGFSESELVEFCPSVAIQKDAKNHVTYPGGAAGRSKRDYSHIAVIVGGQARCYADAQGRMLADVTVSYAVEPGSLYRGTAEDTVFAAVSHGGRDVVRKATATGSASPEPGGHATATALVRGLLVGGPEIEESPVDIVVGFETEAE